MTVFSYDESALVCQHRWRTSPPVKLLVDSCQEMSLDHAPPQTTSLVGSIWISVQLDSGGVALCAMSWVRAATIEVWICGVLKLSL